jgi:5S rRNA maturation endonuclease (ribonuclease M5)
MKIIIISLSLFVGSYAFAQTHQLVQHDGIVQDVNFIKQEQNLLFYSNPESQEQKSISIHAVAAVKDLKSSEKQNISSRNQINSKDDYLKVVVLDDQDQAVGLKVAEEFKGQVNKAKGISVWEQFENTKRAIKYRAAEKGYPFVTIEKKANGKYVATAYTY